jgi:SAM-dependent methyltransferase
MLTKSNALYDRKGASLVKRYESISFDQVHRPILDLIPHPPALALDVGAGSGRDAAALAARQLKVFAVEPSKVMRFHGQRIHRNRGVTWIDDRLPRLSSLRRLGHKFDFILVSAVWMHLTTAERPIALRTLTRLLKRQGILVITLRLGRTDPVRRFFVTPIEELTTLAHACNLDLVRATPLDTDKLQRRTLSWRTVVLTARQQPYVEAPWIYEKTSLTSLESSK